MLFLIMGLVAVAYITFMRYVPVVGVPELGEHDMKGTGVQVIDIRDYNESYQDLIPDALNIPVAYIPRYYTEVLRKDVLVVASNQLEKNIGIRLLRQKGFRIVGYRITDGREPHIYSDVMDRLTHL